MNVKELIEKYKSYEGKWNAKRAELARQIFLEDLKQLDEPRKVKVHQFVADWYEENKDSFEFNVWDWIAFRDEAKKSENREFNNWINDSRENPIQTLVNMHQFGYEVEEEKRYLVKIKGDIKENMLVYGEVAGRYFFTKSYSLSNARYPHTLKELEQANFGWVFDCPGIEIEEVE